QLLHKQIPLYALTNWSAETFVQARKIFEFLSWFRGILVSGEVKLKKPDPRIYEALIERFQINPHSAIFIDDVPENVAAAERLRLDGIHLQSPDHLQLELVNRELLP